MKVMHGFDSNYRYVMVAARRARQLSAGAPRLVASNTSKVCRIALDEIAAGKIQYLRLQGAASGRNSAATPASNS